MDPLLGIGWEGHVLGRYIRGIILLVERHWVKDGRVGQENVQFMSAESLSVYIDPDAVLHFG